MKKTLLLAALIMAVICMLASCINHTHSFGEWEITKNPTCSTDGEETRYCVCGEAQSKNIPAHAHIVVTDEAVDPTCAHVGLTEGKHCSACGEVITAQNEIAMLEHTYASDLDATCEVCGFTRYVDCSHAEVTVLPAKVPTCTEPGVTQGTICNRCDLILQEQKSINALGHKESDWIIEKTPTETEDGYKYKKCSQCGGKTEEATILAFANVNLDYNVNSDGKTCTITGIGAFSGTDLIIPEYIKGYKVTAIGENAFENCQILTKITLPDTVTTIGTRAFCGCTGITEFTIPASVDSIGTQIFYKADNLATVYYNSTYGSKDNPFLNTNSITKIVFGGTAIHSYICYNSTSIKEIQILDSVTKINQYAFAGCTGLTEVIVPDSVTSIGRGAFADCSGLTAITIPFIGEKKIWTSYSYTCFEYIFCADSYSNFNGTDVPYSLKTVVITGGASIDNSAFSRCSYLTSIVIPDSVTWIGNNAFYDCSSLKDVYYTGSVEKWCNISFSNGSSNPTRNGANLYINGTLLTELVIPDTVTKIKDYAFRGCTSIASIVIPDSVTSIGYRAFSDCESLASIEIPDSVTSIGDYAFDGCSSLVSVEIGDSVTSIGEGVFRGCSSLTSVEIGNNVTSIGNWAFSDCTGLTSIVIPDSVTSIGNYAFDDCKSITDVYYTGTEAEGAKISIGYGNGYLANVTIHYNYVPAN